jgi:hypothetical protein
MSSLKWLIYFLTGCPPCVAYCTPRGFTVTWQDLRSIPTASRMALYSLYSVLLLTRADIVVW